MVNENAVVDWQKCLELVNHKTAIAREMLVLFAQELPVTCQEIAIAFEKHDYETMNSIIHKLQGACSYCSVPNLTLSLNQLATDLEQHNYLHLHGSLKKFNQEAEQVLIFLKAFL